MFVVNGRFLSQKPTGIHRYAMEICNHLYDLGVDFFVAAPANINPDYDLKCKVVECGAFKDHLWEQISLPRYLKKNGNPLLVSFSGCGPLSYNNQIMTIHDVSHERHPEWFSKNYWRYYGYMMPRIVKKAHAVITVSEYSKKEIIEVLKVPSEKLLVANCSIPTYHMCLEDTSQTESNNSEKYIISVSSFDPRKNFRRLIEAFNLLEDKDIKLYIVGMQFKAFNTPDLQNLINDRVVLPGYIDDHTLKQLYNNALFSIYPSLYEGFGIPPLESMANGCPVIGSDIEAIHEVCGDAVLYVDPYDVDDMANKMNLLIKDENSRSVLIKKGFEQIKNYSWGKSAKIILNLIEQYT